MTPLSSQKVPGARLADGWRHITMVGDAAPPRIFLQASCTPGDLRGLCDRCSVARPETSEDIAANDPGLPLCVHLAAPTSRPRTDFVRSFENGQLAAPSRRSRWRGEANLTSGYENEGDRSSPTPHCQRIGLWQRSEDDHAPV